ncbi:hypothetical protein [Pseudomonas amygdali]|uniref:hypothetical protein n=1 Tax=Pseudomonas amygdali TaxID=47877 RepID=UPI0006B962CD|nr:hypothetical protein [Pseudomonas amygdali]
MMIDWSKAPEGATHYYKGSPQPWRDLSGYNWKYFMNGEWHLCPTCCTSAELMRELGKVLLALPLPQVWNGEGLPPVGTVCERRFLYVEGSSWRQITICFIGEQKIFYRDEAGEEWANLPDDLRFRPIRTAEQIAADERAAAIEEMWTTYWQPDTPTAKAGLGLLWDAGYRKQVTQCASLS